MRAAMARYEARLAGDRSERWETLAGVLYAELAEAATELELLASRASQSGVQRRAGDDLELEDG
jgi:hypothetical protein